VDFYRNRRSGKLFVSLDCGGSLINPIGKTVPFLDDFYDEVEATGDELTNEQRARIETLDRAEAHKAQRTKEENIAPRMRSRAGARVRVDGVKYSGCNMTLKQKAQVVRGEAVIVHAFGRHFFLLDIKDIERTPGWEDLVRKRAEVELMKRMQHKGTRGTRYRIDYGETHEL